MQIKFGKAYATTKSVSMAYCKLRARYALIKFYLS